MTERIDTKAALADPLWLPEDTPTGIVYRCGYCSTIQPSSIYARERHTDLCPRPALAQEITDRQEAERRLIRCHEDADTFVKELKARIEALVGGLTRFGDHLRHCRTWQVGLIGKKEDCTCGLWALIGYDPEAALAASELHPDVLSGEEEKP